MRDKFFFDLGRVMDEIFDAAQNFGNAFKDGFSCSERFCWDEKVDFYPAYSYPPANVYLTKDKELVFEFALSGFAQADIDLCFQGDYMVLSVKAPEGENEEKYKDVKFFKRRLKLREIKEQKYYVPANHFSRDKVSAVFNSGLLSVTIPSDDNVSKEESIRINIKNNTGKTTADSNKEGNK